MLLRVSVALVYERLDYRRALLLAEAAFNDGQEVDAESLLTLAYSLMDELNSLGETDDCEVPFAAALRVS